ncbi:Hypothetical predicted protein, partial [Marmota monax]
SSKEILGKQLDLDPATTVPGRLQARKILTASHPQRMKALEPLPVHTSCNS